MLRGLLMALGVLFVTSAIADETPDDKKKLQGVWLPVKYEVNGKELPQKDWGQKKWEVQDGNVAITTSRVMKTTMELDPKATPAKLDLLTANPKVRFICIYKFDGENLIVCCHRETRPSKFETKADDERWMITFKREK